MALVTTIVQISRGAAAQHTACGISVTLSNIDTITPSPKRSSEERQHHKTCKPLRTSRLSNSLVTFAALVSRVSEGNHPQLAGPPPGIDHAKEKGPDSWFRAFIVVELNPYTDRTRWRLPSQRPTESVCAAHGSIRCAPPIPPAGVYSSQATRPGRRRAARRWRGSATPASSPASPGPRA